MCLNPSTLDSGIQVGCSQCWQCRATKVNDWTARCTAESMFSTKTYSVTLTYDDKIMAERKEEVHTVALVYKDVQDFMKRLRRKYKVRYCVVGEYGSKRGRAHFHCLLFFKGAYPDVEQDKRIRWKFWKNGLVYFQQPDWKGFRYALKYILKDQDQIQSEKCFSMSKKPPIGHQFFKELAKLYVENGLAPQNPYYKIKNIKDNQNNEKKFYMMGKTRENFLDEFMLQWDQTHDYKWNSEYIDEYIDKKTHIDYTDDELEKRLHYKPVRYVEEWQEQTGKGLYESMYLVEGTYDDIPIYYWENDYNDHIEVITEDQIWQEQRPEVVKTIKQGTQIKSRKTAQEVPWAKIPF